MRVGFIGLGLMGGPMAANIARSGLPLTVWNRTAAKSAPVVDAGATLAETPAAVGAASDVLVTMLSDDAAVEDVLFGSGGVAAQMVAGSVVVDMSTTSPEAMRRIAARLAESGIDFVDAPVFGSTGPATTGDLWIVAGADEAVLDRVRPVLEPMSQAIYHMGPVGAGSSMKVAGNLVVTGMIALLGESLTIAKSGGIEPQAVIDVLNQIDFASPVWSGKGDLVVNDDFAPRFPLKHALKDVRLALAVAKANGIDLKIVPGSEAAYAAAADLGLTEEDVMAVIKGVRP